MDQLEDDLKQVLQQQRMDPPPGFEQRVLARLSGKAPVARPFTAWAVAAAFVFASFAGVAIYQQQKQERRALEARDQLLLALRVTGQKLDVVRSRINHNSVEAR